MKADLKVEIKMPTGVTVSKDGQFLLFKGPKGEITKKFHSKKVITEVAENTVVISSKDATKREKKLFNTFKAHVTHMVVGVIEGHEYKLKICSGHFPMSVAVKGTNLEVKNFLGEAYPRTMKLKAGVVVKVNGDIIDVSAPDKEISGQTAADIEQLTRITNRDRRIFQDGIFITEKSKTRPIPVEEK